MVEMTMRDEDIDVPYLVFHKLQTKRTQSGPGIKNEDAITAADLKCKEHCRHSEFRRGAGTGNASSDAPEPNPHRGFQHSVCLKFTPQVLLGMNNNVERIGLGHYFPAFAAFFRNAEIA